MPFTDRGKNLLDSLPLPIRRGIKRAYYARQLRGGSFESEEPDLRLAIELLRPGDWVIDVGANIGHYTLPLAGRVGDEGRIIAIEPVLETFELLGSNVNAAGFDNVTLLNLACSSAARTVGMEIPRNGSGFRWMTRARVIEEQEEGGGVLALPLDRLRGNRRIRLVKIDAEGHEAEVLSGMREILERDRPLLIVEASPGHRVPILDRTGYETLVLRGSPNVIYAAESDFDEVHCAARRLGLLGLGGP